MTAFIPIRIAAAPILAQAYRDQVQQQTAPAERAQPRPADVDKPKPGGKNR